MIKVILAYRVSQTYDAQAGELKAFKQQFRSILRRGDSSPNARRNVMFGLGKLISEWRVDSENNEVILMMDANKYTAENADLAKFARYHNLVDYIPTYDPQLAHDPTYIDGSKRLYYMFISPDLEDRIASADHNLFYHHHISDHNRIYARFRAGGIFDTKHIDGSHVYQRSFKMERRDILEKYQK